jgi:hypothetical protein
VLSVHVEPESTEHRREVRARQHHLQLLLDSGGFADVVVILYRVKLSLHQIQSPVECYRSASVRLAENTNPPIVQEIRNGVETVISASVIDNYDVQVPIRLV